MHESSEFDLKAWGLRRKKTHDEPLEYEHYKDSYQILMISKLVFNFHYSNAIFFGSLVKNCNHKGLGIYYRLVPLAPFPQPLHQLGKVSYWTSHYSWTN